MTTKAATVRQVAEVYCVDHPGAKVYVDLGGDNLIEGVCDAK